MTDFPADDPYDMDARLLARRTMTLVRSLARAAGEGTHHLTVVLAHPSGFAHAECLIEGPVPNEDDPHDPLAEAAYLLAVTTMGVSAMLLARSLRTDGTVTFMSWMVRDLTAYPATAEQSRSAYAIGEDRPADASLAMTFMDAPELV
ncbi:hypothetical protein [Streptomyces sp. NPDC097981]|uniref:hypothetical protein n=1 Tax=Streptomyces sp. NPDC097981 TaxID=3155428 RepID=UPI00332B8062